MVITTTAIITAMTSTEDVDISTRRRPLNDKLAGVGQSEAV
jgi:hypothetical protein